MSNLFAPFFSSLALPTDPNAGGTNYINFLQYRRDLFANANIVRFAVRFDSFETESGHDFLACYRKADENSAMHQWSVSGIQTGSILTGTPAVSMQSTPLVLSFTTDGSESRPGFTIGAVRVCGATSGVSTNEAAWTAGPITPVRRHQGILIATGDTVFFQLPDQATDSKGWSKTLNLALTATSAVDFDIYVKCNSYPSASSYDYRAVSPDSYEFLSIPQNSAGVCNGGTWYIAVTSKSGAGVFSLFPSLVYGHRIYDPMRVGVAFNATEAQLAVFSDTLAKAGRKFYGQTEGQVLIRRFDLFNNAGNDCSGLCGGVTCNVCFKDRPGTGAFGCDGAQVCIHTGYHANVGGVAHEFGHAYLKPMSIWDEYNSDTGANRCGHSNMSDAWGSNTNFCWNAGTGVTQHDHGEDRTPGELVSENEVWRHANSEVPTPILSTPDNYDFIDHDFNGQANIVVRIQ